MEIIVSNQSGLMIFEVLNIVSVAIFYLFARHQGQTLIYLNSFCVYPHKENGKEIFLVPKSILNYLLLSLAFLCVQQESVITANLNCNPLNPSGLMYCLLENRDQAERIHKYIKGFRAKHFHPNQNFPFNHPLVILPLLKYRSKSMELIWRALSYPPLSYQSATLQT